jgi:hypothetical protein
MDEKLPTTTHHSSQQPSQELSIGRIGIVIKFLKFNFFLLRLLLNQRLTGGVRGCIVAVLRGIRVFQIAKLKVVNLECRRLRRRHEGPSGLAGVVAMLVASVKNLSRSMRWQDGASVGSIGLLIFWNVYRKKKKKLANLNIGKEDRKEI